MKSRETINNKYSSYHVVFFYFEFTVLYIELKVIICTVLKHKAVGVGNINLNVNNSNKKLIRNFARTEIIIIAHH